MSFSVKVTLRKKKTFQMFFFGKPMIIMPTTICVCSTFTAIMSVKIRLIVVTTRYLQRL